MTSAEIQWKTPAGRQQAGAASKIAEILRANQGQWAIIEEFPVPVSAPGATPEEIEATKTEARKVRAKASSRASLIKQGRVAAFRSAAGTPGAFRAVSRSEPDEDGVKVIRVYAVYDGEEAAAEAAPTDAPPAASETVSV
jgi:hypothetical protein